LSSRRLSSATKGVCLGNLFRLLCEVVVAVLYIVAVIVAVIIAVSKDIGSD